MQGVYESFYALPDELNVKILTYLSLQEQRVMESVSCYFRNLLQDTSRSSGLYNPSKSLCTNIHTSTKEKNSVGYRWGYTDRKASSIYLSENGRRVILSSLFPGSLSKYGRHLYFLPEHKDYFHYNVEEEMLDEEFFWKGEWLILDAPTSVYAIKKNEENFFLEHGNFRKKGFSSNFEKGKYAFFKEGQIFLYHVESDYATESLLLRDPFSSFKEAELERLFLYKKYLIAIYKTGELREAGIFSIEARTLLYKAPLSERRGTIEYTLGGGKLVALHFAPNRENSRSLTCIDFSSGDFTPITWPTPLEKNRSQIYLTKKKCLVYNYDLITSYDFDSKQFSNLEGYFLPFRSKKITSKNLFVVLSNEKECRLKIYNLDTFRLLVSDTIPFYIKPALHLKVCSTFGSLSLFNGIDFIRYFTFSSSS